MTTSVCPISVLNVIITNKKIQFDMPIPAIAAAGAAGGAGAGAGTAAGIAGSIGAAASSFDALGGLGLGIASLILQRRANALAREDQRFYWSQSLPAAQMAMRRAAGLNPYGDFQQFGAVSQPVNTGQGIGEAMQGIANSLHQGTSHAFEAISQRIALKQLKLEEKRTDNDTLLANANEKLIKANVTAREIQNYVDELSKDSKVGLNKAAWGELIAKIALLKSQTFQQDTFNATAADRYAHEIDNLIATGSNIRASTRNLKASTRNYNASAAHTLGVEQRESELFPFIKQQKEFQLAPIQALDDALEQLDADDKTKPWIKTLVRGLFSIAKAWFSKQ